jgi:TonB family protein
VQVQLDHHGNIVNVEIIGKPFDSAAATEAIRAVRNWRFEVENVVEGKLLPVLIPIQFTVVD